MATPEQIAALDQAGRSLMGCGCLILALVLFAIFALVLLVVVL